MTLPLADVRVLSVEQFGAGPWGTLQLADLGAEIIKIEDPASAGDVGRYVPPFQEGEDSLFFETFNRGKKSVSLDLRHPEARGVLHDLVRVCDAVYSNLRGDQPRKLGLTYEQLRDVNPRIVCCSLSGFGMTGPRASEGGYDYMMQGLAGWQSLTGEPGGPPTKSGLSLVDLSGGYASAIAMLAGIWRARRDGVGCDCDVSLFETALHELMYIGTWAATHGYVPPRRHSSAHPTIVPVPELRGVRRLVRRRRGEAGVLGAAVRRDRASRAERGRALRDDGGAQRAPRRAVADPRGGVRGAHRRRVDRALLAAGVPASRVNTVEEALVDPQTHRARGRRRARPPDARARCARSARRCGWRRARRASSDAPVRGPFRGEHTEHVLVELCGYTPGARARARRSRACSGTPAGS